MNLNLDKLRKEEKHFRSKSQNDIARKLLVLIELVKLKEKTGNFQNWQYLRISDYFDLSPRTIYRWKSAYEQDGAMSLSPLKARGRAKEKIHGWHAKYIRDWRGLYNWGAEVIQAHLEAKNIKISQWRINEFLRKNGFLKKSRKKKIKNKHTKIVIIKNPGEFCQLDVKHLPHIIRGKKIYVYNFSDHASRWEFKYAFDSYGPSETELFLQMVFNNIPFVIHKIQSDNGVEFTNKYISHIDDPREHAMDSWCEKRGIAHKLIPVGEKEINGLIERSHRMDDEELYHRTKVKTLSEFNQKLSEHCKWKNSTRRRKALGWKTPNEYIENCIKNILDLKMQFKMNKNGIVQEQKVA